MVNHEIIIIISLSVCMSVRSLLWIMKVVSRFWFISVFSNFLQGLLVLNHRHINVLIGRILASWIMTFLKDWEGIHNKIVMIRNQWQWKVGDTCRFHFHLLALARTLFGFWCSFWLVLEVHLAISLRNTLLLICSLQWTTFSSYISTI